MHEALVTDMHVIPVDLPFDAETDSITRLLARRNLNVERHRLAPQSVGHRMLQTAFNGRSKADQMIALDTILVADDVDDFRSALGERAGFVEDHRVNLGKALHVTAALDDDPIPCRVGH